MDVNRPCVVRDYCRIPAAQLSSLIVNYFLLAFTPQIWDYVGMNTEPNRYIKEAAIHYEGQIWVGKRHGNIILDMRKAGIARGGVAQANQGFITYDGKFLTREQALVRAVETGQVDMKKKPGNPTQLFSEDLY